MTNVGNLPASFLKGLDLENLTSAVILNLSTVDTSAQTKASLEAAEKDADVVRERCKLLANFAFEIA
jgi:hypothetical protein